jgi:hypothetical protein
MRRKFISSSHARKLHPDKNASSFVTTGTVICRIGRADGSESTRLLMPKARRFLGREDQGIEIAWIVLLPDFKRANSGSTVEATGKELACIFAQLSERQS